jgi:hypothetical protein
MFKHKYLTMRIRPSERGLEFHPDWAEECVDTECNCTDGCTQCSGDCTGCTVSCVGPDSAGALIPDREGKVELVLDLEALEKIIKVAAKESER